MPQTTESTKKPYPGKEEIETQIASTQITSKVTDALGIEENNKWRTKLYSSKSLTHRLDLVDRGLETDYLTKLEDEDREALRETLEI